MGLEKEPVIQRTQELVRIPSVSGQPEEGLAQIAIAGMFRKAGIHTTINPDYVTAQIPGQNSNRLFIFMVHPDVVPVNDRKEWHHDPFAGHIENGLLYGRGSADMKSGAMAAGEAMLRIKKDGNAPCDVMFVSATDEERSGKGAKQFTKDFKHELDKYNRVAIVYTEPSGLTKVHFGHKGNLPATIRSTGDATHSSLVNELGKKRHAVKNVVLFNANVFQLNDQWARDYKEDPTGTPTITVSDLIGNTSSVHNQVAPESGALIDLRTNDATHDSSKLLLGRLAEIHSVDIDYHDPTPPAFTNPNSPLIHAVKDLVPGIAVELFKAASDMGHTLAELPPHSRRKIEGAIIGPGLLELAHKANEHVPLEQIVKAADIYTKLYYEWARN